MSRPARSLKPSLNVLDKRTLLSAGQLSPLVAACHSAVKITEVKYYNYINVETSGFHAVDVTWQLYGQKKPGGGDELLERGRIGNLTGTPVRIASNNPSSSSFPAEFRFEYKVGKLTGHANARGTSWNRSGPQPTIPTFTLPAPR